MSLSSSSSSRASPSSPGEAMIAAIDSLTDDYAMPLRLRFLDEMPLNRIAAFMGVPLSTVKWRIHYGKKMLRAKLEAGN